MLYVMLQHKSKLLAYFPSFRHCKLLLRLFLSRLFMRRREREKEKKRERRGWKERGRGGGKRKREEVEREMRGGGKGEGTNNIEERYWRSSREVDQEEVDGQRRGGKNK